MGRIPDEKKLEILRATDIVELIQPYVPLKRAGANFKGLCPFHNEKTPSFIVNPARQSFHCFGCHKGGDCFTFLVEHDKVSFPEALKILADRAGIHVEFEGGDSGAGRNRPGLLKVLQFAADFYHRSYLDSPGAAEVRDYVTRRGISAGSAAQFKLGYAPNAWDALLVAARKKEFSPAALVEGGLACPRRDGSGHYDRFRHRLQFPIWDGRDQVIGFGARTLDGTEPKYLNSPETPTFSKGRTLYGINFARGAAAKTGALCIMEGYTDVIVAHQFGFTNAVATLGTALTEDHVRLLRRYAARIYVVYDGDAAGEKAAERSLDMFLREDLELRVATLPAGLDPDECLLQRGKEVFQGCLDQAKELFEYRLEAACRRFGTDTIAGQTRVIEEILESLQAATNTVRRDLQVQRLAVELKVDENTLRRRLNERTAAAVAAAGRAPGPNRDARAAGAAGPAGAVGRPAAHDRVSIAGEWLIEAMLADPQFVGLVREQVPPEDFPTQETREIAEGIFSLADSGHSVTVGAVSAVLGEGSLSGRVVELAEREFPPERARARIDDSIKTLVDARLKARSAEISRRLREAREAGDRAEEDRLLNEKLEIERARR
ncbi:MAG: DNA primase [Planctomycetes bacterium]|nr:DNA primase [Planctomycetota bacterium]